VHAALQPLPLEPACKSHVNAPGHSQQACRPAAHQAMRQALRHGDHTARQSLACAALRATAALALRTDSTAEARVPLPGDPDADPHAMLLVGVPLPLVPAERSPSIPLVRTRTGTTWQGPRPRPRAPVAVWTRVHARPVHLAALELALVDATVRIALGVHAVERHRPTGPRRAAPPLVSFPHETFPHQSSLSV
jgi:hypothetical protein